jgi:hypothetical protein
MSPSPPPSCVCAHDEQRFSGATTSRRFARQLNTRHVTLAARYESHAVWLLEDTMAGSLATVEKMLTSVWQAAVKRVGEEVAEMQSVMAAECCGHADVQPWDYRFWNEKVRKAKFALDDSMLKPYLQLERLRDGMFWVAQQLYGPRCSRSMRVVFSVTRDLLGMATPSICWLTYRFTTLTCRATKCAPAMVATLAFGTSTLSRARESAAALG